MRLGYDWVYSIFLRTSREDTIANSIRHQSHTSDIHKEGSPSPHLDLERRNHYCVRIKGGTEMTNRPARWIRRLVPPFDIEYDKYAPSPPLRPPPNIWR